MKLMRFNGFKRNKKLLIENKWMLKMSIMGLVYLFFSLCNFFMFDSFIHNYVIIFSSAISSAFPMFITGFIAIKSHKKGRQQFWQILTILLSHTIIQVCFIFLIGIIVNIIFHGDLSYLTEVIAYVISACYESPFIIIYYCSIQVFLLWLYINSLDLNSIELFKTSCNISSIIATTSTFIVHIFYREAYSILKTSNSFDDSTMTINDLKGILIALLIGITLSLTIINNLSDRRYRKLLSINKNIISQEHYNTNKEEKMQRYRLSKTAKRNKKTKY